MTRYDTHHQEDCMHTIRHVRAFLLGCLEFRRCRTLVGYPFDRSYRRGAECMARLTFAPEKT